MALEYRPLDLSDLCNVGLPEYRRLADQQTGSYLEARLDPPVGRQHFRGIPFQIGAVSGVGKCFVAPSLPSSPVVDVSVGRKVRGVLVAHVFLGTDLWEGASFGREIARYVFHAADHVTIEAPIRERLEIGNIPLPWGQYPLLSVPDRDDVMEDQHNGSFARAGFRQTEIQPSSPAAYFLWFWPNPRPEILLQSISIEAPLQGLIIAGITLSHVAEDPLRPQTRRTARITVDAASEGGVRTVRVDRGLVTYPQPLPAVPIDEGLLGYPGWGALASDASASSMYVDIAAIPSATITIGHGHSELAKTRWADVEAAGGVVSGPVRIELIDPGRNWVRVTVSDAATGKATPCRVAFQTPDGVPFAPHGHHGHVYSGLPNWNVDVGGDVRLGQVTYAYIDGNCEGWLPRGALIVDVARGFESEPLRIRTWIEDDQRELHLVITRWVDMNASGWYSGDTHVHFLSSQGALLEAGGEDLNVVNLLQSQWGHLFTNTEEFTGRPQTSADGRHLVWVSQENREHILGHLGLLGLTQSVMPWATGVPGEGELGGAVETTASRWADETHAQDGIVVLSHFGAPNIETSALIATGRADAVEMCDQLTYEHLEYYRYLNDGYRLPLVAGTDKMSSGEPVGLYRTYVQLGADEPFSFNTWSAGIRAGRTFITSGPMIRLTVDGHPIGNTLHLQAGATVEIECEASSILPMFTLQLIERGRVIDETGSDEPARTLRLRSTVRIDGPTWLTARCGGPAYQPVRHFDDHRRGIMAHTSPVYIATGPEYHLRDRRTSSYMLSMVSAGREYLRSGTPQYPAGTVTHRHGQADHLGYLEEPFIEAQKRIMAWRRDRG